LSLCWYILYISMMQKKHLLDFISLT